MLNCEVKIRLILVERNSKVGVKEQNEKEFLTVSHVDIRSRNGFTLASLNTINSCRSFFLLPLDRQFDT